MESEGWLCPEYPVSGTLLPVQTGLPKLLAPGRASLNSRAELALWVCKWAEVRLLLSISLAQCHSQKYSKAPVDILVSITEISSAQHPSLTFCAIGTA